MRIRPLFLSSAVLLSVGTLFASTSALPTADSGYYSYTAQRGRWPANAGTDGDRRYVTADLTPEDTPTLASMKATGRDLAVLYTGWDWCEAGALLLPAWRKGLGQDFVTTVYDWPETPLIKTIDGKPTDLSARSRDKAYAGGLTMMPLRPQDRSHAWPAIGLADSEGNGYALFSAVNCRDAASLRHLVQNARTCFLRYKAKRQAAELLTENDFMKAAQAGERGMRILGDGSVTDAGGRPLTAAVYRAALLADALTELEPNVRRLGFLDRPGMQKAAFDLLRTWDPEDTSGARRRLCGDDRTREAARFVITPPKGKSNDYPDGITPEEQRSWCIQRRAQLATELTAATDDTRLVPMSDNELQQGLLFGHNLYRGDGTPSAEAYARAAVRVNPASFWGEAARGRLLMCGIGPVTLNGGWGIRHLESPVQQPLVSADGRIRLSTADIQAQDRFDADSVSRRFTWMLRWGNDMHFVRSGWYTLTMTVANTTARKIASRPLSVESFRIYSGTRQTEDTALSRAKLLFDGSAAIAARHPPAHGDTAATFTPIIFPKRLEAGESLSFVFYLPHGDAFRRPSWEKDTSGLPPYNDLAIVISGTSEGPSVGSFTVRACQTAPASATPRADTVVMDGQTLSLKKAFQTLDTTLAATEPAPSLDGDATADRIEQLIDSNATYRRALVRAELFYEYELPIGFRGRLSDTLSNDTCGQAMLSALLNDERWLTSLLASGPEGFYRKHARLPDRSGHNRAQVPAGMSANAAERLPGDIGHDVPHRLAVLWEADALYRSGAPRTRRGPLAAPPSDVAYDEFLRQLAAAYALNITGVSSNILRTHYMTVRKFIDEGRMHGDFYTQTTPQLRFSAPSRGGHPADMEYTVRSGNTRCDSVNGTAWQMHYRLQNFFGTSVHSRDYYRPFTLTAVPSGAGLARDVGAVCGGISNYGAACGTANGRRALTGGQPGHCAGAHRSFDGRIWNIDSNVSAPTGNHLPLWIRTDYQSLEMFDDLFDDPKTLTGYRLLWAARLRALRYGPKDRAAEALMRRALLRAPLNYQVLLDYRNLLSADGAKSPTQWHAWRDAVVRGFWRYPRAAWDLLNASWLPHVARTCGEKALAEEIRRLYTEMQPSDRITREPFDPVPVTLAAHLSMLKSPQTRAEVTEAALESQFGRPGFVKMLRWGMAAFRGESDKTQFYRLLDRIYRRHDAPLGTREICLSELFYASRKYQMSEFRALTALQRELWPEAFPEAPAAPQPASNSRDRLLSADGMLTLAQYPRPNRKAKTEEELRRSVADAFYMARILGPTASNEVTVHTKHNRGSWIVLQLRGDAEIRKIVLSPGSEAQTVRVEVSSDRKQWVTVADSVHLSPDKKTTVRPKHSEVVRYVRVQSTGEGHRFRNLTLSRFHVYGTGRY